MKKYLLPKSGNFYKANMHCHTTLSDGKKTPEEVKALYPDENLEFGDGYIIPKPFDRRLFVEVSYAVAEAAVKSGVAAEGIDLVAYRASLEARNATR